MKNRFFLFILLFLSAGICAEQHKITDEDILKANSQIDLSIAPSIIAPCNDFLVTTNEDPYVILKNARDKASKRTKSTYAATMSEIVITDVSAALQDAEMYFTGNNYVGRRPDHTGCKYHGHHNLPIVMILGDGSTYKGTANYDCSYTGYQPISSSVGSVSGMVRPEQWAPWYVEHTVTQHISITSFAKSAGISNEEMVKRILYYGIDAFVVDDRKFWGDGVVSALFRIAGYEPKMAAFRKKEYAAGMAEWEKAKEDMKKEQPNLEKASQLYISASEHLWYAKQLNYDLVEEIDSIFINKYILPLYKAENVDKQALHEIFDKYSYLVESTQIPNSKTPYKFRSNATQADKSAVCLMWLVKAAYYDSTYFAAYNKLRTKGRGNETINRFLEEQKDLFIKTLDDNIQTNPEFVILATNNFLNNPMECVVDYETKLLYNWILERAYRARMTYFSKNYDVAFFENYNAYYYKRDRFGADVTKGGVLWEQRHAFFETLERKAKTSPKFMVRVCTHYMNNPLKGPDEEYYTGLIKKYLFDAKLTIFAYYRPNPNRAKYEDLSKLSSTDLNIVISSIDNYVQNPLFRNRDIDSLIVTRTICTNILNQRNIENHQFNILNMLRYQLNAPVWNLSKEYNGEFNKYAFYDYYYELNRGLAYSLEALCTMIINGESNKVLDIYRTQLDSIIDPAADVYFEQSDIFNYINLYNALTQKAQSIKQYALDGDAKAAAKMKKQLAKKMLDISERGRRMDYNVGVHAFVGDSAQSAQLVAIRKQWSQIRKQIDICKQAANYDEKKDFLVVVRTNNPSTTNPNLELCFNEKAIPVSAVYVDGQMLDVQPTLDKSSYRNRLIYKPQKTIKSNENTDWHCIIFKSNKGINSLESTPVIFNGSSTYLVIEYPPCYSKGNYPKDYCFFVVAH